MYPEDTNQSQCQSYFYSLAEIDFSIPTDSDIESFTKECECQDCNT